MLLPRMSSVALDLCSYYGRMHYLTDRIVHRQKSIKLSNVIFAIAWKGDDFVKQAHVSSGCQSCNQTWEHTVSLWINQARER